MSTFTTHQLLHIPYPSVLLLFIHPQEVNNNYFGDVLFLAVFTRVKAVGELAFDGDLRSFVGVLEAEFCLLASDDKVLPGGFGDFFTLLVFVGPLGGEGDVAYGLA